MYVSSRAVLVFLLACCLLASPTNLVLAKRGGGGGGQGRPNGGRPGSQGGRPGSQGAQGDDAATQQDRPDRPQGGNRPPRGPPGTGVFSISADKPVLLGSIEKSRGVTLAGSSASLTAIYESKVDSPARRSLLDDKEGNMVMMTSASSDGGVTWSTGTQVTINNLPTGLIARRPTLSSTGDLFFVGATGDLKHTPSAIYLAKFASTGVYNYAGLAFGVPGKIMSSAAVAGDRLIVPNAGDTEVEDAPATRKLLRRGGGKGPGGKGPILGLAKQAYVADCTSIPCQPLNNGALINMTEPTDGAAGRGGSAWVGSMLFQNGKYEFYGSGKGNWPLVSSDAITWTRSDTPVDIPGPAPSCVMASSLLCAAPGPRPDKPDQDGPVADNPPVIPPPDNSTIPVVA
jgi:hypothetical protein